MYTVNSDKSTYIIITTPTIKQQLSPFLLHHTQAAEYRQSMDINKLLNPSVLQSL